MLFWLVSAHFSLKSRTNLAKNLIFLYQIYLIMAIEWNLILRILIAGLLGGLMGFEREMRARCPIFRDIFNGSRLEEPRAASADRPGRVFSTEQQRQGVEASWAARPSCGF